MIFLIIFTVIIAFFLGLFIGYKKVIFKKEKTLSKQIENLQTVETEYRNFLNYDGSVQQ